MKNPRPLAASPTDTVLPNTLLPNTVLPATTDQLLEQLDWARSLARRLVADPNVADDLVQESYVRALQHPPAHRPGEERRLRAWFGRVLTNAARQRRRGEGRRSTREQERATPEALPSVAELTEAAEGQRLLIEALLELDEDLRRVVLLRHYQGLSSAEIARCLGEPDGTIRWRLSAALDDLRGKLDRKTGGDRGVWQSALLPLAQLAPRPLAPAAAAPASLSSGLSVGALALAAAAVLVAGVGLALSMLLTRASAPSIEPSTIQAAGFSEGGASELVATSPEAGRTDAVRGASAGARPDDLAAVRSAPMETPESAATGRIEIRARFVDAQGRGVAGVRLVRHGSEIAASEADGSLSVALQHHGSASSQLLWMHPDHVTDGRWLPPELEPTNDLGVIALQPGGGLVGRLINELGQPLVGYDVEVLGVEFRGDAVGGLVATSVSSRGAATDQTDEEGRFQLSGLLPGKVDLVVDDDAEVYSTERKGISIAANAPPTEVELRVEPIALARQFSGRVVGPDGEPVKAQLHVRYSRWFSNSSRSFSSDRDGSFAFSVPSGVSKIDLEVRPSAEGLIAKHYPDLRSGQVELVLQLDVPRSFRVAASVADGGELPADLALVVSSTDGEREFDTARRGDSEGPTLELRLPDEPFRLLSRARGYFNAELTPLRPDVVVDTTLEVELTPRPTITGSIAGGSPEQSVAALHRAPRGRIRVAGQPSFANEHPDDQAAPDALGGYRLFVTEAGRYYFRATAPGHAAGFAGPFQLDPTRPFELPAMQLTPGGTVEGTVARSAQEGRSIRVMATSGDGVPIIKLTDSAGNFRFEHLRPGAWHLAALDDHAQSGGTSVEGLARRFEQFPGNVEVSEGRVTRFDIGLLPELIGGTLVLRVDLDPALGTGWEASLVDAGNVEVVEDLSADGETRIAFSTPGALRLVLRQDDDLHSLAMLRDLQLGPGEQRLELVIRAGTVEFAEPAEDGEDATPKVLLGEDAAQELFFMRVLEPGQASVVFPAGTVSTADAMALSMLSDPRAAERFDSAELRAGGTVQVQLP